MPRMTPIDVIPGRYNMREEKSCYHDVVGTLDDFLASDYDAVEIDVGPYHNATSCAASYDNAIRRDGYSNVHVCRRRDRVFLHR